MKRAVAVLPEWIVHAAGAALLGLLLVAVGQPIFTDDLWWHLAIGADYAREGPWLARDPFLFGAERAPEPAAWLADVAFHLVHRAGGFQALRVLHVALATAIFALGWTMLRRASGSRLAASLGTAVFASLAAYRVFQLRPELFSILATLVVVRAVVLERTPPSTRRLALVALVMALWANAHGAFVIGLGLLGAAFAGALAASWLGARAAGGWPRVRRLGAAVAIAALASCLNPAGPRFLLLYFRAGEGTPDLEVVADEWARVDLFAAPLLNVPPTPLVLALVWLTLLAVPLVLTLNGWLARRAPADEAPGAVAPRTLDPALLAVGAVSLVAALLAVRLIWLVFFAVLVLAHAWPRLAAAARARPLALARVAAALAAVALVPAFVRAGDWQMISRGVSRATYANAWSTAKYHAHGVYVLHDAGLEGRLWNDYWLGNFLGYWLAPRLLVFVNGSLNVPPELMQDAHEIRARRASADGETIEQRLERRGVDVYFGSGIPVVPPPGRPSPDTTRHLERSPDWQPIFRNLQTALYLRRSDSNRANVGRIAAWYEAQSVPFDPERGFEPERVIRANPAWAIAHGLLPADFAAIAAAAERGEPSSRRAAQERLASLYLLLGMYAHAAELDERVLAGDPRSLTAARRLVWSRLRTGPIEAAVDAAARLESIAPEGDVLSRRIADAARRAPAMSDAEREELLATLPVFTRPQGQWATAGFVGAEVRAGRE